MPLAYLHRGGKCLTVFAGGVYESSWVGRLTRLVTERWIRGLDIQWINGDPPADQAELRYLLLANGLNSATKAHLFAADRSNGQRVAGTDPVGRTPPINTDC